MTKRILLAGVAAAALSAIVYQAPGQSTPAAPAVRIQAGDGGTLGLAHTIRIEGAAAPSLDGGVASIYVAAGAGGVLSVSGTAPVASSGGLTPTVSLTPCAAGQILKSDGGAWGCTTDLQGVTRVTATAPIYSSGGAAPNITCAWASASNGGCISLADWGTFNGKENPLSFGDGLLRTDNSVACVSADAGTKGCVTTAAQSFAGVKNFTSGIISDSVTGKGVALTSRDTGYGIALTPGAANATVTLVQTNRLSAPSAAARTFYIDAPTTTAGRSVVAVTNSGNAEETYAADFDIPKGDLYTCSTKRIDCDGNGTFASLTSSSWGVHSHTSASTGGQLAIGTATTGALPAARVDATGCNDGDFLVVGQGEFTCGNLTWGGGTLAVSHGGTGSSYSLTQGGVMYASATNQARSSAAGTAGEVLVSSGSGAPTFETRFLKGGTANSNSPTTPSSIPGMSWGVTAYTYSSFDCLIPTYGQSTNGPRFGINYSGTGGSVLMRAEKFVTSSTTQLYEHVGTLDSYTAACTSSCLTTQTLWRLSGRVYGGSVSGTATVRLLNSTGSTYVYVTSGGFCTVY